MCNGIILLENVEDLKDTALWSKEIKFHGNRFFEALEKKVVPVEDELSKKEADINLIVGIQEVYQDIFSEMASLDVQDLLDLRSFIKQLKNGDVYKASPEEVKKLQNG
tara:strand:+ start:1971 stop:2294 length:324 start_codon:yes stop_codon:yes gene_type:complete